MTLSVVQKIKEDYKDKNRRSFRRTFYMQESLKSQDRNNGGITTNLLKVRADKESLKLIETLEEKHAFEKARTSNKQ